MFVIYFLPFFSILTSILWVLVGIKYKKIRSVSIYVLIASCLNFLMDAFLLNYTENNSVDLNTLELVRYFQIVTAIICIVSPSLWLFKKIKILNK